MPLKGQAKTEYMKKYMRDYRRQKRVRPDVRPVRPFVRPEQSDVRPLRADVEQQVQTHLRDTQAIGNNQVVEHIHIDADGNPIPEY